MNDSSAWPDRVRRVAPGWAHAFDAVPREWFVPDIIWRRNPDGRGWLRVDRASDPEQWDQMVARDEFVVTQVDDGEPGLPGEAGRAVTSSSSMPTVMAVMLQALDTDPRPTAGTRVLEIGTATAWNTALLSVMLGADNVTTIEIDPALLEHARARLAAHGFAPTVVCGDGELGHLTDAPSRPR